jgi:hypothetical protein
MTRLVRPSLWSVALAGVCACAPAAVTAQTSPDSVQQRNNCRLAEQVLAAGHPAPREEWALGVVWNCAEAGPTLARSLSAARASTDTAYLNALTAPSNRIRDGSVFAAAANLAQDRSASVPARVAAFRTLIFAVRPGWYVDFASLMDPNIVQCFLPPSPHSRILNGTPLPADYVAQVGSLASRIRGDSTEPRVVRSAANCAMYAAGGR